MEKFSYKGYFGSGEIDQEDGCLSGKILYVDDLIMYEGQTFLELKAAFQDAVDDYLVTCASLGKEPNKSFSGHFNIRIGADNHLRAWRAATRAGKSLNDWVKNCIVRGTDLALLNSDVIAPFPHREIQTTVEIGTRFVPQLLGQEKGGARTTGSPVGYSATSATGTATAPPDLKYMQ